MVLPGPVIAFMLLSFCNLNESETHLVMLAIDDVSYEKKKAIIMRVFCSEIKYRASSEYSSVDIKVEPTYANVCGDDAAGDSAFYARSFTRGRYNFWPRGNRRGGRIPRDNRSGDKSPRRSIFNT